MKAALIALGCAAPARAEGAGIALPSGREVVFHDVVWGEPGPAGLTVRFRFVEADIAAVIAARPYEELEADMEFLCESYAIDRIANIGPQPSTVMVSISDRPVEFGEPDPAVTQVFEAYRPENGACLWEGY
ncbi:MAG: acetolactate synthase [Rhodobacterales bacterium CG2_30_65_12]|nr:MAG: acetolactate synthase [Rhodobacterales bacterium CG2_30_65_12]